MPKARKKQVPVSATTAIVIDKSGNNGDNGSGGYHGSTGGSGGRGSDGTPGQSARPINITLEADPATGTILIDDPAEQTQHSLPLGNARDTLALYANGGDGGNGGAGGSGGDGHRGHDGSDATRYSHGTNGGRGGDGGNGGNGGNGKDGGDAADITVTVAEEDTDLLMLIGATETRGGERGRGGHGGSGGSGGAGGRGGSSYSWTDYTQVYDSSTKTHRSVPHYHSNPGGSNGYRGSSGSSGYSGSNGSNGSNGKFIIAVPGLGRFSARYDLSLSSVRLPTSDDGILEPEEALALTDLSFTNIGDMPTPTKRPVTVALRNNQWIKFAEENTLTITRSIKPDNSIALDSPLLFSVKPHGNLPTIDDTFRARATLDFDVRVTRVNKDFATTNRQARHIDIRYPVELSMISGAHTITRRADAPVAIALRNVSTIPIGINAEKARALSIDIRVTDIDGDEITFAPKQLLDPVTLAEPIYTDVELLQPSKTFYLSGLVKFSSQETQPYSRAKLVFSLNLGRITQPDEPENIQQRTFEVQLADSYQFNPDANFVLVTNNQTSSEHVDQWRTIAHTFGTEIAVWNTSLYGGVSYTRRRNDGSSLIEELAGKTIIILDNDYENDIKEHTHATAHLDSMEIMNAAKAANISTYVIGSQFDMQRAVNPADPRAIQSFPSRDDLSRNFDFSRTDQYATADVGATLLFWQKPTEQDLALKARKFSQHLHEKHPNLRSDTLFNFAPEKKPDCMPFMPLKDWHLGTVEVRQSLENTQAQIAQHQYTDSVNAADIYAVIKLASFEQKLEYLTHIFTSQDEDAHNYLSILKDAILSDLISEVDTYTKEKWANAYGTSRLKTSLTMSSLLRDFDFAEIKQSETGKEFLRDLLLKYEYVAKYQQSSADHWFIFWERRRHLVSNVCTSNIKVLFNNHFKDEDLTNRRKALVTQFAKTPRQALLNQFIHPYASVKLNTDNKNNQTTNAAGLPDYHYRESTFIEDRYQMSDPAIKGAVLANFENKCGF